MAKILNLDKLSSTDEKRELVIAGTSHKIIPMTVDNFIATTVAAAQLANKPLDKQIEATVEMIMRSVPTVSREVLGGFQLERLSAITAFVRGEDVEGSEEKAVEVDEAGK